MTIYKIFFTTGTALCLEGIGYKEPFLNKMFLFLAGGGRSKFVSILRFLLFIRNNHSISKNIYFFPFSF